MLTIKMPAYTPRSRTAAQAPWTGWPIAVMALALLSYGIDIVLDPFPGPVSNLFETFATPSMFLAAAGICAARGWASREERSAWALLALALAMFSFGELYYLLVLADRVEIPVPSVADGLWLAFYPLAYAGVYKLLRNRTHGFGKAVWLDALMGGLTVAGATAALVFGVILASLDGSATVAATATNLAYPLGDLGLIGLAIAGIAVTGWKASGAWRWIAVAFVLFAVADTTWLLQIAHDTYTERGVINLVWPLAALLIAVASWRPETRPASTRRSDGWIVLPALFGFAALALVVIDHIVSTNVVAATLAMTAIFVMLVRLYLTVREHARMLVQSRVEASTDALTGLGNRRLLEADLAARLDGLDVECPLMVTLFDLDGFKQYNDSFGHPAGDQLLERLGGRLSALMVGHGTAYRMGGDEFCALWNLSRIDQASVKTLEAAKALSQEGKAFSIRCSYGSVLMPNETTDPVHALALADRRMYARKGDRQTSAGRQSSDVLLRALAERDSDLSVHLHGVAEWARATAIRLGVPDEELEGVRQTSLLHDVGKVAIPDAILLKPGPLDESEWAFMKQHTIVGERIIAAAPALADVARYVRSTHELYDGSGYPDGLAGEKIPLPARIVAVCDAYHAMTSDRAYRDARSSSSAIAELRECAGTQFDPRVVEAFASAQQAAGNGRLHVVV